MTPAEAMAEVFLTAFINLPHTEQESFLSKLLKNKHIQEDIIDLALAERRKHEKTRSFKKLALEIKTKRGR